MIRPFPQGFPSPGRQDLSHLWRAGKARPPHRLIEKDRGFAMNDRHEFLKALFKALGVEAALFLFYGILPYLDGRAGQEALWQQAFFCLICGACLTLFFYWLAVRRR